VPKGTHHHEQFINPDECKRMMGNCGLETLDVMELGISLEGELQERANGGNYLIAGRKSEKAVN
jgi:2-polyprenyl-3-methyl-5-hydroxy-6-metoxy-1,4-benzoquinol methylase